MLDRSKTHAVTVALMSRLQARDEHAVRGLYDLHGPLLFGMAMRLLHDRTEAEQLLIDVFTELWQHADRYDAQRGDPVSYLLLLTRSRAIDRLRSMPKRPAGPSVPAAEPAGQHAGPLEQASAGERVEILREALGQLSEEERTAVELSFIEGLSHSEIAERLRKPLGTIKTHVRQGLIHLRSGLRILLRGDQD